VFDYLSNKYSFLFGKGTTGSVDGRYNMYTVNTFNNLNKWSHLVYNINSFGNIDLYVNGVYENTTYTSGTGDSTMFSNIINLGAAGYDVKNRGWTGEISDLKIYNRILTEQEAQALYEEGTGKIEHNFTNITIYNMTNVVDTQPSRTYTAPAEASIMDNCTLWLNGTLVGSVTCSSLPMVNLTEGVNELTFGYSYTEGHESNFTYYITLDTVNPIIVTDFINNSKFSQRNITGQFNFSDPHLFRWNVTLNGVELDSDINTAYTSYIYNLSVDYTTLPAGKNTLVVEVADGHTSKEIGEYDVKTGGWFDDSYIEFDTGKNKIRVQAADKMFTDKFEAEKHKDRYKFMFRPSTSRQAELIYKEATKTATLEQYVKQSFLVESEHKIHIVERPDSEYNKWIVAGNNWVDFLGENIANEHVEIKLINDNTAEVTVYYSPDVKELKFESIGDLNVVTNTYNFYVIDIFLEYISPIITETPQQIVVKVNTTDSSYAFTNVSAVLRYNGVNKTLSKTFNNDVFSFTTSSFNAMSTTTNIDANISVDITFTDIGTIQINETQTVSPILLVSIPGGESCPVNYIEALNIFGYDEGTPTTPVVFEANIAFDILSGGEVYRSLGQALSGHNNYTLCLFPDSASINVNAWIEYDATNYSNRKYFLQNYELNNESNTLNLYLLDDIITSDIIINVFDKNKGTPLQEAMVKVQRYYPQFANESIAAYKTVEIGKTDVNGETLSKLILGDVWYRFIVEYPAGTIVYTSDVERILTVIKDLPVLLGAGSLIKYNELLNINAEVTYNPTTQTFTYIWSNPTNTDVRGILRVYQDTGFRKILIYETSAVSSSATLAYQLVGNISQTRYIGEGYISE